MVNRVGYYTVLFYYELRIYADAMMVFFDNNYTLVQTKKFSFILKPRLKYHLHTKK